MERNKHSDFINKLDAFIFPSKCLSTHMFKNCAKLFLKFCFVTYVFLDCYAMISSF